MARLVQLSTVSFHRRLTATFTGKDRPEMISPELVVDRVTITLTVAIGSLAVLALAPIAVAHLPSVQNSFIGRRIKLESPLSGRP